MAEGPAGIDMGAGRCRLYRRYRRGRHGPLAFPGRGARRDLADAAPRYGFPWPVHLLPPCRRLSRTARPLVVDARPGGRSRTASEGSQSLRLYRRCVADRRQGGRRGHPCRCLEKGDRLGAREPGPGARREIADPLDLRRRHEVHPTRGAARQPLRHHPHRPAEVRPRSERRSMAIVRSPGSNAGHLPRDPVAGRPGPRAHRLFDPGELLFDPRAHARDHARARRPGGIGELIIREGGLDGTAPGRALSTSLFSRWVPK